VGDELGVGSYRSGGTKDALTFTPESPPGPASSAACKSPPYLS
jgi:hypothetical protein